MDLWPKLTEFFHFVKYIHVRAHAHTLKHLAFLPRWYLHYTMCLNGRKGFFYSLAQFRKFLDRLSGQREAATVKI